MKNFLLISASVLVLSTAANASPIDTHTTHTPRPESVSSYKIAAVYFVPDYNGQKYEFEADTGICSKIGYNATVCLDENMYVPESKRCPSDNSFFNVADCICKPEFNLTACSDNKVLGDDKCGGKAKECVCPAKYQYTVANCTDNKTLSGGTCDNKYEKCACDTTIYIYDTAGCKSSYGTNAVTSGKSCGGKYNGCSCTPNAAGGWATSAPTCNNNGEGYETTDSGCGGTYYKCKPCQKNTMPGDFQESSECTYGVADKQDDGCGGTYYKCGTCANECSLASCPDENTCRQEECSEKYCITGCATGRVDYPNHWCNNDIKCWFNSSEKCPLLPDCNSLGYKNSASDCNGVAFLRCPFDISKYFCPDSAISPCNLGTILFSDKTCGTKMIDGKTPIGVVFDPDGKLAVAIDFSNGVWLSPTTGDAALIPEITTTTLKNDAWDDLNGKSNTKVIYDHCKSNGLTCDAAVFAYEYKTEGTSSGDWYLPSAGEADLIEGQNDVFRTLDLLGKREMVNILRGYNGYWTSTQFNKSFAWMQSQRILRQANKNAKNAIIPILKF